MSVPGVLSFDLPDARRANSFDRPFSQVGFILVLTRCRYSNNFPVVSSNTALIECRSGRMLRRLFVGGRGRTDKGCFVVGSTLGGGVTLGSGEGGGWTAGGATLGR